MHRRSIGSLVIILGLALSLPAAQATDLAIVGGVLLDGNEGTPIQDSVVLIEGNRISRVGTVADTEIPTGAKVINANGYTVLPGLNDAHVHLMIVGHGIYDEYFPRYKDRLRDLMAISAKQLLMHGVTSARDLGAPLEDIMWVKREVESGRIPGPRLFVSGPFLQKTLPAARGTSYDYSVQSIFRWTVDGPEDARAKTRTLIDAGVDLIKVIQVGQLSSAERAAIREEAQKANMHIAAHGGFLEDIKACVELGVNSIEHMGGGSKPLFDEETVRVMAENRIVYSPTSIVSKIYDITRDYPERLDNQELKQLLPAEIYEDVRDSLKFFSRLNYFSGAKDNNRNHAAKIRQLYQGGVRIVVGTDSGTPMNFHSDSTWQEMDLLVRYGMPPMKVISAATRLPALLYRQARDLGTIEPGKLADIIVVDGNPLRHMSALKNVVHVIKDGKQYK